MPGPNNVQTNGIIGDGPLPEMTIDPSVAQWFADLGLVQITGWRVWLSAGREYNSKQNTGAVIPSSGCQIICFYSQKPYRTFCQGLDDYFLPDGTHLTGTILADAAYNQLIANVIGGDSQIWPTDIP